MKLVLVMVPGSVEDERVFSTIHDEVRNRLKSDHLNLCMRMYLQNCHKLKVSRPDVPEVGAL